MTSEVRLLLMFSAPLRRVWRQDIRPDHAITRQSLTGDGERFLVEFTGETLELNTLESYLWKAADILRGTIDSSDYKNYSFGLLFLKRLSDRFEEEVEELVEKGVDEDIHQFYVPEQARWSAIQAQSTDIGAAINKALEPSRRTSVLRRLRIKQFNDA